MSRAKTSHRIRRAKNARTGNQILLRKIGAICGRAAVRSIGESIELARCQFVQALQKMAQGAAQAVQGIRNAWGPQ